MGSTTVFTKHQVEGRDVTGKISYDGEDYHFYVETTQLDDYAGRPEHGGDETTNNRATTAIPLVVQAGFPIEVDGATLLELHENLISEASFSAAGAATIVSKFPRPG